MKHYKTGIANLPLHGGYAPRWLFERMVKLSSQIVIILIEEFGSDELLKKLSDPFWFQSIGCVVGFDWHSSGLTTTLCGALKEALKGKEDDLGVFVCGGKGKTSRKTPDEIRCFERYLTVDPNDLIYASKMSAKVDNTAVQDGYQLYHHCIFFTKDGQWCVVQQGMNQHNAYARRYHWLKENNLDFVCEPHSAVCCNERHEGLNMIAYESDACRDIVRRLPSEGADTLTRYLEKLKLMDLPRRHAVLLSSINPRKLYTIFCRTYEVQISNFQELLSIGGVGPKTLRALSLISELIYNTPPSYRDPARFSFAHGGKDGHPYKIKKDDYDKTIEILEKAIKRSKVGDYEKIRALKKLTLL